MNCELVVLVHRGKWVVLRIQFHANNKVASAFFCPLKMQDLIPDKVFLYRWL